MNEPKTCWDQSDKNDEHENEQYQGIDTDGLLVVEWIPREFCIGTRTKVLTEQIPTRRAFSASGNQ